VALECDSAHHRSIGGGGAARGDSSERLRRGHGGAPLRRRPFVADARAHASHFEAKHSRCV
jgi:hypothetical protein